MKKLLSMLAIFGLTAFATAQNSKIGVASPNSKAAGSVSTNATAKHSSADYVNNISPKAVRDLEKKFKTSSDVKWQPMDYGFRAKFISNGISYRVDYDKKGNRIGTILTYDEKHLPSNIRSMIKGTYYDYTIVLVEEVSKPNSELTYLVHLEGENEWINVRVQNGDMDEWQRINKAK